MTTLTKNKPKAKSTLVWVAGLNHDTFIYEPIKAKKKECDEIGYEYFLDKEGAQIKCDKLNCI